MNNPIPTKKAILIIDDEPDICFLLKGILEKRNFIALSAQSISEAREILNKQHPLIIFLDNHLPDGLGLDHIKSFKQLINGVRVVMVTAHDNLSDRQKAMEEGADLFIRKPFTRAIIHNVLEELSAA